MMIDGEEVLNSRKKKAADTDFPDYADIVEWSGVSYQGKDLFFLSRKENIFSYS
jgi:hypothetical protein